MHRDDWEAVYLNQDRILGVLKSLKSDIVLAGGTGLHRFMLSRPYRYSEDLDFFFPMLVSKDEAMRVGREIVNLIESLPDAKIKEKRWFKEEQVYRIWCGFDDNHEIIKIELLNFTCTRVRETAYSYIAPFKTENFYNLLLYKLKALCDRPDTIKDLFDLYFIWRELPGMSIDEIIRDLNSKFKDAIGICYTREEIISALNHHLTWDIETGDIPHLYDMQREIAAFQERLRQMIDDNEDILDFSYQKRIVENAKVYGLDLENYLNLIDVLEENNFWIDEVKKMY